VFQNENTLKSNCYHTPKHTQIIERMKSSSSHHQAINNTNFPCIDIIWNSNFSNKIIFDVNVFCILHKYLAFY